MESSLAQSLPDLLVVGLELMLLGMGTVFVFLTLLVAATRTMSRLVRLLEGDPLDAAATAEESAAFASALELHRRRAA